MEAKFDKFDKSGTMVICQICGKSFKMLTPAHLKRHGMTLGEYQLTYRDFPITGAAYSASHVHSDSILFKDKESLPIEKLEIKAKVKKDKKLKFKLPSEQKNKQDILNYLIDYYPFIENNYVIEKINKQGLLNYKFTVDIADPFRKTIFDFTDAYWHNKDNYPDHARNLKLKDDGWIVISIKKHYPTIIDVKDYTDNIIG